MAILYPNNIINIYVQGVEFTGNVVSVGNDGMYSYDYSHPQTAAVNEASGSLILIYPGTYVVGNTNFSISNKDFIWRGMGDDVTDVYINQGLNYSTVQIGGTYSYILLENFNIANNYGPNPISFRDGSATTDTYVNKLSVNLGGIFSNQAPIDYYYYNGNSYVSYSYLSTNHANQYRGIKQQTTSTIYHLENMEYTKAYGCIYCLGTPDIHTFNISPGPDVGYNYGEFLVQFNVSPPIPPKPLYQNVWATTNNIYHTTTAGVDIYNSNASALIGAITMPNSDNEYRTEVNFNKATTLTDFQVLVTLASGCPVYSYTTDGNDINFRDAQDNALGFWIEDWTVSGTSSIWVTVPDVGTGSIYMYFNNNQGLVYNHGDPNDGYWFYDDFSTVYSGTTGLSPHWVTNSDSDFLVSGGKLRVSSGAVTYSNATIEIDKNFGFKPPIYIEVDVSNISSGGSSLYGQFGVALGGGTEGQDRWHWYGEGSYDRRIYFTGSAAWKPGTGRGFSSQPVTTHTYIGYNQMRLIADRTSYFDDTFYGTTRTEDSYLQFFTAYTSNYDVNYIKIRKWDNTGDVTGLVSSTAPIEFFSWSSESSVTAVWANESDVYISTMASGIYTAPAGVSGTTIATTYKQEPEITSNNTIYIHGAGDYLCTSTHLGVDRYNTQTDNRIYTPTTNIHKCFQTTSGTLYYIENNEFYGVDESSSGIGGALSEWKYFQDISFAPTVVDNENVRVRFDFNFPYQNASAGGVDIRFLDSNGNNLPYYIEEWYPTTSILVKVVDTGTSNFYMLYGNSKAFSQSSLNAYHFHDEFTTIDTDVWQLNPGHSNSYITSNGEYATFYDYDNAGTDMMTKQKLPYSLRAVTRMRRRSINNQEMDFRGGYGTSTAQPPNRGYVSIGNNSGNDNQHRIYPYWDSEVTGTKWFSTSWVEWEFILAEGYSRSSYDNEILYATPSGIEESNYWGYHINNTRQNYLDIDWVRIETYPLTVVSTSTQQLLWDFIRPRLHAVYDPSSNWTVADYTYENFYGDPLLLNDIYVTEETSSYNDDNTIFLATDRGAHIIEERQGSEENADSKRYYIK